MHGRTYLKGKQNAKYRNIIMQYTYIYRPFLVSWIIGKVNPSVCNPRTNYRKFFNYYRFRKSFLVSETWRRWLKKPFYISQISHRILIRRFILPNYLYLSREKKKQVYQLASGPILYCNPANGWSVETALMWYICTYEQRGGNSTDGACFISIEMGLPLIYNFIYSLTSFRQ